MQINQFYFWVVTFEEKNTNKFLQPLELTDVVKTLCLKGEFLGMQIPVFQWFLSVYIIVY